ncbi:MAG: S8 family serine peptidase [Chloroflexi bacterium]|nr:S8 family serine peptidase [Chloroflexota bacterium]
MRKLLLLSFLFLLATAVLTHLALAQPTPPNWQDKVDPWVLERVSPPAFTAVNQPPQTEFLVTLTSQADLSGAAAIADKEAKGAYVYERLTAVARQTHPPVLQALHTAGAAYRSFWVTNMIWVRGDFDAVQKMAQRPDVAYLHANPTVALRLPTLPLMVPHTAVATTPWNINQVNAPAVWTMGITGQRVVIGGQDTGYDWNHEALINQYRGWDGVTADHNYNWHYSLPTNNTVCAVNLNEPCDDYFSSHGTHTMGTMVGNDLDPLAPGWPISATHPVGMAPGAQWIGCRNMNQGVGTPASYAECYEWFIAPYPLGGNPMSDGDPSKAPHVVNNSWGCPINEGCTQPTVLETVVNNVRAAGIVTVHSAGNSGPGCNSVNEPATIYDASFSVGATSLDDSIAGFSSRGPSSFDGRLKPDISAPGLAIRSTKRDDDYTVLSGTSMAAPHVAGLVALLISADPTLAGNVDLIELIIQNSAVPQTTTEGCGGDSVTDVPNHTFGYGRVDALSAILDEKSYLPLALRN